MAEKMGLDALVDQASRMLAAGWRGNPNMSGDDRDFMTPSHRRRHDERVRSVVEFVLSNHIPATGQMVPGSTGSAEGWVLVPRDLAERAQHALSASDFADDRCVAAEISAMLAAALPDDPTSEALDLIIELRAENAALRERLGEPEPEKPDIKTLLARLGHGGRE